MSSIITITLNTSVDIIMKLDIFERGMVSNAISSKYYPAGKGINVSRAVACSDQKTTALGFVGRLESLFFNNLNNTYLSVRLLEVPGQTRSSVTLIDTRHGLIAHIRGNGFLISQENISDLLQNLRSIITSDDVVVIAGSIPPGCTIDNLSSIIQVCSDLGAKVICDVNGKLLKEILPSQPYAVKPNLEELVELSGRNFQSEAEIITAAKQLNEYGIELVFVSLGANGAILTKRNVTGYWKAISLMNISDYEGEEIGSGDAMVAGISIGITRNNKPEELLRLGVTFGTANLLIEGPGIVDQNDITRIYEMVSVTSLKHYLDTQ